MENSLNGKRTDIKINNMKKNKIIVIAIIVAVVIICLFSIKYLPFWSTIISTLTAVAGFFAGWYAKKWYDQNRKEE